MRHRGEPLKALQHVVDMAFGRDARRRPARVRRRARLPQGQGHRAAADGEAPRREGEADRPRSAARAAQSLRAPHRAPGRRRGAGRDDRERRRRVLEDRPHLAYASRASDAARRPVGVLRGLSLEPSESRCSPPPTPSSPIATPPGRGGIGVVRLSGPRRATRSPRDARSHATRPLVEPRHADASRDRLPARRRDRSGRRDLLSRAALLHRRGRRRAQRARKPGRPARDRRARRSARGARLAEPGEFTLRAFLNGRIDLMQAEAVADLIDAVTPLQARAAFDQLAGHADARDRRRSTRRCSI